MPGGLSRRSALLLVALAFAVAFAVQALPPGGASTEPAVERGAGGLAARDLQLAAAGAVPALRQPRQRRERVRRVATPAPVTPAPIVRAATPEPTVTPQPTAVPAPPSAPPPPPPPALPPPPTPAPTAAPPSGEFDTTGEDEFDATGEP